MPDTNFDLAPPPKTVDGLLAVPIDIQRITASLTFDGATSMGSGDATLEFMIGPHNGNPIFDLRQTITAAWLDGASIPVAQVAHHDFGGGANAHLRVVETLLKAGTTHTLRVTYDLGPPQASTAGSYQPTMTWSAGPRLVFNFGFTDLGAGRYLEAWIPANLIFDQFELDLELQVLNTAVTHTVITNGIPISLGANHWSVKFPDRFTAFSPLLELRAADTLASMTDTTILPVSGTLVTIEAWKLASSPANLATEINNLKTWLANNETSTGPYLHGNRFVAFLNLGGMEYEGATTSGAGALRHETFHSWYARGLKPATQPDAWWDEAWTVYNDLGASGSLPFDFTAPPVELRTQNPWVRITAPGSYTSGERFFEGIAAQLGVANLRSLMSSFYNEHKNKPVTSMDLEEFLVCRSGVSQLVDFFHRFIYGFSDPSPVPDLWIRDDPGDAGNTPSTGRFWDSPDLWIRNFDDGGLTHQSPEYGQDNWFYARIRNRSKTATARHFLVTFNVKSYAGIEFQYPADFLPCTAAKAGFDLGPGATTIVKARWPATLVPPVGTHPCLLATVFTRFDAPSAGRHVWENNNLAQKNLTVVNLAPDEWFVLPFVINRLALRVARRVTLELVRPPGLEAIEATLLHRSRTVFRLVENAQDGHIFPSHPQTDEEIIPLDCSGIPSIRADTNEIWSSRTPNTLVARQFGHSVGAAFEWGRISRIPILLPRVGPLTMGLRIRVPADAKLGQIFNMDLLQRDKDGKQAMGGLAIEIHVS